MNRARKRSIAVASIVALALAVLATPAAASAAPVYATITGKLVDENYFALGGVQVGFSSAGGVYKVVTTKSDGSFSLKSRFYTGFDTWAVSPYRGSEDIVAHTRSGQTTKLGTIPWVTQPSVEGSVSGGSSSVFTRVSLISASGKAIATDTVEEDGTYAFSYAKPGSYTVRADNFRSWTYAGDTGKFEYADFVTISPTYSVEQDILPTFGTSKLHGTLKPSAPKGSLALLSVKRVKGSELDWYSKFSDGGSFTFKTLPSGQYYTRVLAQASNTWKYFRGSGKSITSSVLKAKKASVATGANVNIGSFTIPTGYFEDGWD